MLGRVDNKATCYVSDRGMIKERRKKKAILKIQIFGEKYF
jgi:hypothetical protein